MVARCAISGCVSKRNKTFSKSGTSFHKIPGIIAYQCSKTLEYSIKRRKMWIDFINRKDITLETANSCLVCSKHFISGQPAKLMEINNPDWVPSLFNRDTEESSKAKSKLERYNRSKRRLSMGRTNTISTRRTPNKLLATSDAENIAVSLDVEKMSTTLTEEIISEHNPCAISDYDEHPYHTSLSKSVLESFDNLMLQKSPSRRVINVESTFVEQETITHDSFNDSYLAKSSIECQTEPLEYQTNLCKQSIECQTDLTMQDIQTLEKNKEFSTIVLLIGTLQHSQGYDQ